MTAPLDLDALAATLDRMTEELKALIAKEFPRAAKPAPKPRRRRKKGGAS
jgi:hypothetical protein